MRRGILRASVIAFVCVLGLFSAGPASAQPLTGEEFFGQGTFTAQPSSTCNPDGTGTVNFTASGNATGPYPGTFTETGSVTFGPRPAPDQLNVITSYSAQFEISGANGSVTGTKELGNVNQSGPFGTFDFINRGECTQVVGFGTNYFIAGVCYAAQTPDGTDTGFGVASGASSRNIQPSNFFNERFQSGEQAGTPACSTPPPPTPTSAEQCKDGGWQTFGGIFKNQGDCVSFVRTNGSNPPAGG